MSKLSNIEWTDHTWSPWWGCVKVSRGCKHCYAEALAKRTGLQIWGDDNPRRMLSEQHWKVPERWNREAAAAGVRYKVFPSMCDPLETFRTDVVIPRMDFAELIHQTPNLDWLVLTKRPENWFLLQRTAVHIEDVFPPNLHFLASVEGDSVRDRIHQLTKNLQLYRVPRVLGLSVEPLVEPLTLKISDLDGISWVIVGGESGSKQSPMEGEWVESIRKICYLAGVPFFFKQWGDGASDEDKRRYSHLAKVREWPSLLGPAVTKTKEATANAKAEVPRS